MTETLNDCTKAYAEWEEQQFTLFSHNAQWAWKAWQAAWDVAMSQNLKFRNEY